MARRKRSRFVVPVLLLAAGMVAGWWLARHALPMLPGAWPGGAAAPAGNIHAVDFRNFNYPAFCAGAESTDGGITVTNGKFLREDRDDYINFTVVSVSYGDLTGDGKDEAAVATLCNTGGTGQFSEGMIYTMDEDKPRLLERLEVGDRAMGGIVALEITDGRLRVQRYGTDDGPYCCPEFIATTVLRWNGKQLVQDGGITRQPMPAR